MLLVSTTVPDQATAERVANEVVGARLAACVSILAPCRSIYHWQGRIESAMEVPLLFKTSETRYAELAAKLKQLHPYELPEIVAVRVADGLPAYLDWVAAETRT